MEFGSVDEILNFAVDREKEAVEFYTGLAKEATRASLKETFESFAKEEEKHVALLSDISRKFRI
jgi:rubrerythrin